MKALFFISLFLLAHLQGREIVSAYAVNMRTKEVVMDLQGEISLNPASCLKVVTTAAALHLLGPESQFQTDLEIDGEIKEGVLGGNVWIRGGGDPCLGSGRSPSMLSWQSQIDAWVFAISQQGIQEIRGRVIADTSRWEMAQAVPSWSWEDLGNYYGAGASALTFHENGYTIDFAPGEKEGDPTRVLGTTPEVLQTIQNDVKTGPVGSGDRACIYGSEFSPIQFIRGTVPAGVATFSIKGAIPDAAALCERLVIKALQAQGIRVREKVVSGLNCRVIHTTFSPKIQEIIYWTNQKSVNLYAEHLLKKMGEEVHGDGSTKSGILAVLEFCKREGIDTEGMNIVDGSGLSRKNFISAHQLNEILVKMSQSPHFSIFFDSLPQIRDGVRAKDGYFSGVRGYAGYKGDVAFTLFINNYTDTQKMRETMSRLMDAL